MKLFGISNHGLAAIGLLVAMLWGVLLMERALNIRAQRDYDEMRRALPTAVRPGPDAPPIISPTAFNLS
jgi:hypothetical protein